MSREWRLYVADMKSCCARVAEYTAGLDRKEFERRRIVYDATLRNLEVLGEAARHIPRRRDNGRRTFRGGGSSR